MKLLLVFALCGITCCLAGPACTPAELEKCTEDVGVDSQSGSEVDMLNQFCRETKCWLKVYDRCGTKVFGPGPFPVKGFHRAVDALCDTSNPLRKEYLENVGCIRRNTKDFKALMKRCNIKFEPKDQFCRDIPKGFKCLTDYVTEECGKDAGDVFSVAALPGVDPYDCLSSF